MERKLLYGESFVFKFKLPKNANNVSTSIKKIGNVAHYVIFLLLVEREQVKQKANL